MTAAIVGNEVINSNYKRVPIRIAFNPLEEKFEVLNPAIQKDSIWIPDISKVFDGSFNAFGFVHEYSQANNITDWEQQKKLSDIITKLMSCLLYTSRNRCSRQWSWNDAGKNRLYYAQ